MGTLEQLQDTVKSLGDTIAKLNAQVTAHELTINQLKTENEALKKKQFPLLKPPLHSNHSMATANISLRPNPKRLATDMSSSTESSPGKSSQPLPKVEKPPQITVRKVEDFNKLRKLIVLNSPKDEPTTTRSLTNGDTKIITASADEYRRVIKKLKEAKYEYHHFQLKSEKPFRAVIRGLNPNTSGEEITQDLKASGHKVRNVTNITIRKRKGEDYEKIPLPFSL